MQLAKTISKPCPLRLLLLLTCCFVWDGRRVSAYGSGAPAAACQGMSPNHGAQAQTSTCPINITTDVSSAQIGGFVQVTLSSMGGSEQFKGFLLQARLADDSTKIVGSFDSNSLPQDVKTLDCQTQHMNAVTHSSNTARSTLIVMFRASGGTFTGPFFFRATIVQVKATYWVNVESAQITLTQTSTPQHTTVTQSNPQNSTPLQHSANKITMVVLLLLCRVLF